MRRGHDYISNNFDFIGFNFGLTMFMDLSMRQAIAHAMDSEYAIVRAFSENAAASAPINPQSWLFAPDTATHSFDLARTEELFGRLGFTRNADGLMERRVLVGMPQILNISILVNEESRERVLIAELLAANLRAAGADAIVEKVNFAEFQSRLTAGDFDVFIGGLSLSAIPDLSFAFHSSNAGASNVMRYASDEMDLLLYIARQASSDMALITAMGDLQRHIAANLPIYGIGFRREILVTSARVHGDFTTRIDDGLAGIQGWFIVE